MRKIVTAALAALTLGGAAMATTSQADAAGYGYHGGYGGGYGYRGGGWGGGALVAGIAGLAVGAAIAGNHPGYYGGPGYYYGDPYYGRPYATCYAERQIWDPYYGRYVIQHVPYAC
jgi:hypothetical protein